MAQTAKVALLFLALSTLSYLVFSLSVPDVPDPVCVGGWGPAGQFLDKKQGGCCSGIGCCEYAAWNGTAACLGDTPDPSSCDGLECCRFDRYRNSSFCTCKGTDCCKYEEYDGTALCVVQPNSPEEECTSPPPECQVGDWAPALLDPGITSESKCRGACGPDCPDTCAKIGTERICMPDAESKCFYVCTYDNVIECGTSEGCQIHDDCYDACSEKGEDRLCYALGFCHCACDWGCLSAYGPFSCGLWMFGYGPAESTTKYSSPPLRSGPFKSCPPGSETP